MSSNAGFRRLVVEVRGDRFEAGIFSEHFIDNFGNCAIATDRTILSKDSHANPYHHKREKLATWPDRELMPPDQADDLKFTTGVKCANGPKEKVGEVKKTVYTSLPIWKRQTAKTAIVLWLSASATRRGASNDERERLPKVF